MKKYIYITILILATIFLSTIALNLFLAERVDNGESYKNLEDGDIFELKLKNENFDLEVAKSSPKKAIGLMNRKALDHNAGMIFLYDSEQNLTFYMKNTLIPLDIIFLDSEGKVVTIHENTRIKQTDELYPSLEPAQFVIELNGGRSNEIGLQAGDVVDLEI